MWKGAAGWAWGQGWVVEGWQQGRGGVKREHPHPTGLCGIGEQQHTCPPPPPLVGRQMWLTTLPSFVLHSSSVIKIWLYYVSDITLCSHKIILFQHAYQRFQSISCLWWTIPRVSSDELRRRMLSDTWNIWMVFLQCDACKVCTWN